ncbi:MAG: DpnII family type II restriction endonuclease [Candidatus Parvarchaeum sp.]
MDSSDDFFNRVIDKNTYFFHNDDFEQKSEVYISVIRNLLLQLKDIVNEKGLSVDTIADWLITDKNSLNALLTLTGISRETFLRLISFIRIKNDADVNLLVNRKNWPVEEGEFIEWNESRLLSLLFANKYFRIGVVNLFFYGATKEAISKNLPLFEYNKLSKDKFAFSLNSLLDTIVRYKYKGSYAANKENNPENLIIELLNRERLPFEKGKIIGVDRQMDFLIPNRNNPRIIIESSYVVTTSSGQGDKAKTEQSVAKSIKEHFHNADFIGFVDGLGWLVRRGDLKRMVEAYDDVFTFKEDELNRFLEYVKRVI